MIYGIWYLINYKYKALKSPHNTTTRVLSPLTTHAPHHTHTQRQTHSSIICYIYITYLTAQTANPESHITYGCCYSSTARTRALKCAPITMRQWPNAPHKPSIHDPQWKMQSTKHHSRSRPGNSQPPTWKTPIAHTDAFSPRCLLSGQGCEPRAAPAATKPNCAPAIALAASCKG